MQSFRLENCSMALNKPELTSLIITGTRPEIIKMTSVYLEMKKAGATVFWCHTGQHKSLADQTFEVFGIQPDFCLQRPEGVGVAMLVSGLIANLDRLLKVHNFRCVLVHGDTASTFAGALTAFYNQVPVIAHVEAGLRSGRFQTPLSRRIESFARCKNGQSSFPSNKRCV